MSTHQKTRDSRIPKMKVPIGNNTVEDTIIIEDDGLLMKVKEELSYGRSFCPIGWSSLKELIQLLELLENTTVNLKAFRVPKAYQLKGIMGELALMAEEILKLERLISPTLSPSISLLFYFFSDQPSIFDYVEGLLEEFKKYLAYREGFHSTLEAHSLKEGEYAAL
ncbi:hypothetical protein AMTR_s00083p00165060 [Amborella trichopoda]|uniref:Uncharacterized protein n=1 Tax=Amborella trichopoda TaxID=13333 RepID=W1P3M9_AMBTC|nr:hypothetical protein AMTR_s00083p00165060 [Amborella trichopoda]